MKRDKSASEKLKELAIATPLIIGYFYMMGLISTQSTSEFTRDFKIHQHSIETIIGIGACFTIAATIFFTAIITIIKYRLFIKTVTINQFFKDFKESSISTQAALIVFLFGFHILFSIQLGKYLNYDESRYVHRVKSIKLHKDSQITTNYEGFIYLKKNGNDYIFTDKISRRGMNFYLINEKEVDEIILSTSPPSVPTAPGITPGAPVRPPPRSPSPAPAPASRPAPPPPPAL